GPWKKPRLARPLWIWATSAASFAGGTAVGVAAGATLASCTGWACGVAAGGTGAGIGCGCAWAVRPERLALGVGGLLAFGAEPREPSTAAMIESIVLAADWATSSKTCSAGDRA